MPPPLAVHSQMHPNHPARRSPPVTVLCSSNGFVDSTESNLPEACAIKQLTRNALDSFMRATRDDDTAAEDDMRNYQETRFNVPDSVGVPVHGGAGLSAERPAQLYFTTISALDSCLTILQANMRNVKRAVQPSAVQHSQTTLRTTEEIMYHITRITITYSRCGLSTTTFASSTASCVTTLEMSRCVHLCFLARLSSVFSCKWVLSCVLCQSCRCISSLALPRGQRVVSVLRLRFHGAPQADHLTAPKQSFLFRSRACWVRVQRRTRGEYKLLNERRNIVQSAGRGDCNEMIS